MIPGIPGGTEGLTVVIAIIIVLVAPKQLPKLARGLGQSIAELRRAKKELSLELEDGPKQR